MKITTPYFGEQEIDPGTIIRFPEGIPGFEQCHSFTLFHEEGKPTVFWLQCIEDAEISFSVALPNLFNLAYELVLSEHEASLLELENPDDVLVLLVLYKAVELGESGNYPATEAPVRSNIKAPIIINARSRIGYQKTCSQLEQVTLLRGGE